MAHWVVAYPTIETIWTTKRTDSPSTCPGLCRLIELFFCGMLFHPPFLAPLAAAAAAALGSFRLVLGSLKLLRW